MIQKLISIGRLLNIVMRFKVKVFASFPWHEFNKEKTAYVKYYVESFAYQHNI